MLPKLKGKKSNLTLYVIGVMITLILIVVAALVAPFGALFSSELYVVGEQIMLDANKSLSNIQNDTIKARIQSTINTGLDATEDNIEVSTAIYQYGWIAFLLVMFILLFLTARQIRQIGGQGGGFV